MTIVYQYKCMDCGERFEYEYELTSECNCPLCGSEEIEDIYEEEEIE